MTIAQQISKGVADALTKLGFKPTTAAAAPESSSAPAAGVITAEIQEAIAAAVQTAVEPIKGQLAKAQEDLTAANGKVTERDTEISRLKMDLKTAHDKTTAAEQEVTKVRAELPAKVATGVAAVAASQGLPAPLPTQPAAQNPAQPQAAPEVKGLKKVQAAIKAQLTKKAA